MARFFTIFAKMSNLATVNFATALFGKMDKIISGFLLRKKSVWWKHKMPTFSLGCIQWAQVNHFIGWRHLQSLIFKILDCFSLSCFGYYWILNSQSMTLFHTDIFLRDTKNYPETNFQSLSKSKLDLIINALCRIDCDIW